MIYSNLTSCWPVSLSLFRVCQIVHTIIVDNHDAEIRQHHDRDVLPDIALRVN